MFLQSAVSKLVVAATLLTGLALPVLNQEASARKESDNTARARILLQRAQSALGGAEKLAAIKDVVEVWEIDSTTRQGTMKARQETRWIAPGYLRQALESPMGRMEMYYDGSSGWYSNPEGVTAVPPEVAKQVRELVFRMPYTLVLSDRIAGRTLSAVGENAIEVSAEAGPAVRLEFDAASGLPSKFEFRAAAPNGESVRTVHTFSNYEGVGGFMVPRKLVMEQSGSKIADVAIVETRINSGLPVAGLAMRP